MDEKDERISRIYKEAKERARYDGPAPKHWPHPTAPPPPPAAGRGRGGLQLGVPQACTLILGCPHVHECVQELRLPCVRVL